jgi:hypothetical protein
MSMLQHSSPKRPRAGSKLLEMDAVAPENSAESWLENVEWPGIVDSGSLVAIRLN